MTMVLTKTSSELIPSLGTLAGTVGVAAGVAVFVVAAVYTAGMVFGKFGWKFLDRIWEPREFALIIAGAMVIGSASGAVTWSASNLYKIAGKPEQAVARPAYAINNDCKPEGFKTAEKPEKVEAVLGPETKAALEKGKPGQAAMDFGRTEAEHKASMVPNNIFMDFKPAMKNDGGCDDKPDACYQVKLTYEINEGRDRTFHTTKRVLWATPDPYDKAACGDQDARQF